MVFGLIFFMLMIWFCLSVLVGRFRLCDLLLFNISICLGNWCVVFRLVGLVRILVIFLSWIDVDRLVFGCIIMVIVFS